MEERIPKLFLMWKEYSKEQFIKDIVAGIIVAIIALPLSIALALASGVSREQGIYTAIVAGFVIAMLGGSRVPDIWSDSSICDDCSRDCRTERNGRSCRSDNSCRSDFDPDGSL